MSVIHRAVQWRSRKDGRVSINLARCEMILGRAAALGITPADPVEAVMAATS